MKVIQKIYTNFEFCEKEEDLKHLKNTLIYKASNHVDKKKIKIKKHNLHILEDNASGVQVVILNK